MPRPEKSDIERFLSQIGSARAGERALTGALVGGALPIGFAAAKGVVSPFLSNIIAQINPEGLARRQVARACREWGRHQMKLQERFTGSRRRIRISPQALVCCWRGWRRGRS